ncbi:MAG TPA: hypothetical protein VF194_10115 [Ferrovibrio sp.]|uniref:hypothetical protein n=1 Tax=Ferrovibrio sp. TaxID=1917215 RepID=UPI002ED1A94D
MVVISTRLTASLLTAIAAYTGYAIPGEPPSITVLPHDDLARQVCGQPCAVLGFTRADGEILLDQALDIDRDPVATSILVHEMTHFLQIRSASTPEILDCQSWRKREREAYDVQVHWLRDTAPSMAAFAVEMRRLAWKNVVPPCPKTARAPADIR